METQYYLVRIKSEQSEMLYGECEKGIYYYSKFTRRWTQSVRININQLNDLFLVKKLSHINVFKYLMEIADEERY